MTAQDRTAATSSDWPRQTSRPCPHCDWKFVASQIWSSLLSRMTPQQIAALSRIAHVHPTTRELADYLDISIAQTANITRLLARDGLIRREKAGRSYRYSPAFPAPAPFHYFDRSPITVSGEAAERAVEILTRRGKL